MGGAAPLAIIWDRKYTDLNDEEQCDDEDRDHEPRMCVNIEHSAGVTEAEATEWWTDVLGYWFQNATYAVLAMGCYWNDEAFVDTVIVYLEDSNGKTIDVWKNSPDTAAAFYQTMSETLLLLPTFEPEEDLP